MCTLQRNRLLRRGLALLTDDAVSTAGWLGGVCSLVVALVLALALIAFSALTVARDASARNADTAGAGGGATG